MNDTFYLLENVLDELIAWKCSKIIYEKDGGDGKRDTKKRIIEDLNIPPH